MTQAPVDADQVAVAGHLQSLEAAAVVGDRHDDVGAVLGDDHDAGDGVLDLDAGRRLGRARGQGRGEDGGGGDQVKRLHGGPLGCDGDRNVARRCPRSAGLSL
jgi:hypothetical protein